MTHQQIAKELADLKDALLHRMDDLADRDEVSSWGYASLEKSLEEIVDLKMRVEVLAQAERVGRREKLTFKTPDVLDQLGDEARMVARKFVRHGEYVTIELNLGTGQARVAPA